MFRNISATTFHQHRIQDTCSRSKSTNSLRLCEKCFVRFRAVYSSVKPCPYPSFALSATGILVFVTLARSSDHRTHASDIPHWLTVAISLNPFRYRYRSVCKLGQTAVNRADWAFRMETVWQLMNDSRRVRSTAIRKGYRHSRTMNSWTELRKFVRDSTTFVRVKYLLLY